MSIVACVKVYDGIVLGCESMTQLFAEVAPGQVGLVKAFANAKKLFQIGDFVGALTYGAGNIGISSVESLVGQFRKALAAKSIIGLTVQSITGELLEFVRQPYEKQFSGMSTERRPQMGFYVAGYSTGQDSGSEWEFLLPVDTTPRKARDENLFGASWRGVGVPFSRLYFGIDPRVPDLLRQQGMPDAEATRIWSVLQAAMPRLTAPIVFDGMPVNDAIGFCRFVLQTTIGQATYELGVASCGGPLQIAVITREKGFQWISELEYGT